MTEPELTPEDLELGHAKDLALLPSEPVPGAEDLPTEVRDGNIADDGSSPNHYEGE